MLVASLSGQHCQTIHALDVNNMVLTKDRCTFYIQELLKTSRPGKHFGKLELRAYHPDKRLCVVTFLEEYVRRTKPLRGSSSLFISYQKPHASVTTDTVGRWLRKVLENSGLDVSKYGAHSTRAASTSAAKTVNICIQSIMDAAIGPGVKHGKSSTINAGVKRGKNRTEFGLLVDPDHSLIITKAWET